MKLNTLGSVLQFYREKYSFRQEKICSGICSVATLSRVESGSKIIDSLVAESMLGRIGRNVLQFEILLNDNDYDLWITRQKIQKLVDERNYNEAKEMLAGYRKKMPKDESVHEQFCLYYEAQAAIEEGKTEDEICEMLYRALKLTKPEIDSGNEEGILYNPTEMEIIRLLIHYRYPDWESRDKGSELLKLFNYVEKVYSGTQKEKTGIKLLLELIGVEEQAGQYLRMIRYADKGIEFVSMERGINYIAELRFIKAKALEGLYHDKLEWKEQERVCKEECRMAYYILDLFKQEKEKQEVLQFCEDKLGWQITK